ncbi:Blue-light-activated histidine kinase [Methyloligella halotolerans]|uniref:Blue-light-activated histidine kinase n=1 Tax=Methyloligella halotolerans TaxID=1177755 RepID=A0A1E2RUZ2_9HYPH|nr:sensor histidine kinase [Methyloligella halotolerans]ODA65955.1 Blue-light-activated histidine kinase [Methyloligella halotolerans]
MSLTYPDRFKEVRSAGDIKSTLLTLLPWAGLILVVAAFLAELLLPLRGGLGACYVLAVLTTFGHSKRYATLAMCGLATALAVGALLGSAATGEPVWAIAINRAVTVAAIWATGACLVAFSRLAEQLRSMEMAAEARQAWLAQTLASIGDGVIASDADGRVEFMNDVAERLTGWSEAEAVDRPIEDVFDLRHEESGEALESPVRRALSAGHIVVLTETAVLRCRDGGTRPLDDSAAPIRNDNGDIIGAVMVFRDVSQRRKDEQQMQLRLNEAGHRIRNVFANVRAIMSLCERAASSPAELVNCVDTRMNCLLRSTDRLMYASEEGSSAREIIIDEIEPYLETSAEDRLHFAGVDALLDASASVSLGMIVHELANNASKYGSLSVQSGRVLIRCHWQDDETFSIQWKESGGPSATEPTRTGLGTQIIGGLVRSQFRGSWEPVYGPEGFACHIALPIKGRAKPAGGT